MGKKTLLLLFCFSFAYLSVLAKPRDCIILHLMNGSKLVFPLTSEPQITIEDGILTIGAKNFIFSNVKKYTFGDMESDGISEIEISNGHYEINGEILYVKPLNPSMPVTLCTIEGIIIPVNRQFDINGNLIIQLPDGYNGIFLLSIGDETIKIKRQ